MSALSDYLEKALLDHLLGTTAYTPVATTSSLYLALFTSDPLESGVVGEVSGGSYARVAILNNATNFPPCAVTSNPIKSNGAVITFPKATAAWGTVTHWAIFDSNSTTNRLWHGALTTPRTVAANDTVKIPIGALQMSFTNSPNGGLTAFAKRRLLDLVFGATPFTCPVPFLGLGTALDGETLTEWSDSGYTRQETAFDAASSGAGTAVNASAETFAATTAVTATLTHFGMWDSATAGNLLATGPLNTSAVVPDGNEVVIADSGFVITLK